MRKSVLEQKAIFLQFAHLKNFVFGSILSMERRCSAGKVRFPCKTPSFFLFLGVDHMNKVEGQIRIPSGCAISAVISKEGKRMTGEKIIESMKLFKCANCKKIAFCRKTLFRNLTVDFFYFGVYICDVKRHRRLRGLPLCDAGVSFFIFSDLKG